MAENDTNQGASIEIYNGTSKKLDDNGNPKTFKAVRVQVGEWSQLIFLESFAMKYVEKQLNGQK